MPQSLADYDAQYMSSERRKGLRFLPLPKSSNRAEESEGYSHRRGHRFRKSSENTMAPTMPYQQYQQPQPEPQQHIRKGSSASARTASVSPSTTASSTPSHPMSVKEASLRAQEMQLNPDVAEWAHQMHITQGRSYWWCQSCFPKEIHEPLEIPKAVEKVMTGRRVRINEPSHCYDI